MTQFKHFLSILCLLAFAQAAFAQATLSVQGTIQKSTGASLDDGQYTLKFKLYTTETGGTPVWSETIDNVDIVGGVYSALLGTVTPLTAAFDQTYYLGITLGSGAEVTPRARLTSSPYSIALIGQNNIVPSSGAVGIGTTTPTAGNDLHVKDGTGAAQVTVEGSTTSKLVVQGATGSSIDFKKGANTASITYDGTNINVQNLNLSSFSPAELAVTSKLAVGQSSVDANNVLRVAGSSFFNGYVEVSHSGLYAWPGGSYWVPGCNGCAVGSSNIFTFSMRVSNRLAAAEFWAFSDRRIKKDFHLSESLADLTALRKLRVTDYRHIDEIQKGSTLKKGFIAQEVKAVFPEAVTVAPDFIPNVYALSSKTKLVAGKMTITLDKNHEFAVGDEVKLMLHDDSEKRTTVLAVADANSFVVDWTGEAAAEQVFVFGKKVADFHTVDYDRIFTLNVSATQELARKVELLEKHNAALEQRNDILQKQNSDLRSDLNGVNQRLLNLEKRNTAGNLEK